MVVINDIAGGLWRVTDVWGGQYLVDISQLSNHLGGSFSGKYWYNKKEIGVGCFPLCDIAKMEKVG